MSEITRKLASIQAIMEILPIDGADKIVKARIKDWWVVTAKDNGLKVGDDVVYFEIDSFLPDIKPFEFLKKGSKLRKMLMDGREVEGIRLRTVKLRGQISQGLIMSLAELTNFSTEPLSEKATGDDITVQLGVLKYDPPLPPELVGEAKGLFPSFIPKTDEERIQNMGDALAGFYVTEKLDGTSVTYFKKEGIFGVCSRNLELKDNDQTQWKIARMLDLENKIPDNFALQGELCGEGIQGNPFKIKGQKVFFFNAYNIAAGRYLDFKDFKGLCESKGLDTVPILDENFTPPSSVKAMLEYANGKSALCDTAEREGVVVRPKIEMLYGGKRFSFKAISNNYLLNEKS